MEAAGFPEAKCNSKEIRVSTSPSFCRSFARWLPFLVIWGVLVGGNPHRRASSSVARRNVFVGCAAEDARSSRNKDVRSSFFGERQDVKEDGSNAAVVPAIVEQSREVRVRHSLRLGEVWSYCPGFTPDSFDNIDVSISPNPPEAGKFLRVDVSGRLLKEVKRPVIQTIIILNDLIPFQETRVYCERNRCPVKAGEFTASVRYYIPPFVSGTARGTATVTDEGNAEPLVCVELGPMPVVGFHWG